MDPQLRQAVTSGRKSFLVAVSAFLILNVFGFAILHSYRDLPFDSARWKTESDLRPQMVRDLIENHNLEGASRESVDALLGVPKGRDSVQKGKYIYWAGTDGIIDDRWLEIEFENRIVVSMCYVSD